MQNNYSQPAPQNIAQQTASVQGAAGASYQSMQNKNYGFTGGL